jgi:aryl-alcohol dehydrogenase-like predicted oxidoreductase/enamine deaminase RidA (YjgF/YER057c/UK114 family)
MRKPERITLPDGSEISRLICGLWQVADMEKGGVAVDRRKASDALDAYVKAGFDTFDMADHYGSAELIAGELLKRYPAERRPIALTKWCPKPGPMTPDIVRAGVQERLDRLGVKAVDLLQFHWWSFEHPAWLDALHEMAKLQSEGLIRAIGVTNFDAAHLALALADGVPIATNQVSFSLVDRRAAGELSSLCSKMGVKLFAYGTLNGGFLSERWLERPEPTEIADWSKSKYRRFIEVAGGWAPFQALLATADRIARRHHSSIANVATRWVLDHTAVAAVIIGVRPGEREHRSENLSVFDLTLGPDDHAELERAFAGLDPIAGDCGDEYRKPPFLTASGDLSHHIDSMPSAYHTGPMSHRTGTHVSTGSVWEPLAGYSRAVRVRDMVYVSGTTATHSTSRCVAPGDAAAQTTYILDKIAASLAAAGSRIEDIVRTRVYLRDVNQWEPVSRAHGRVFGEIKPANTLIEVGRLVGDYQVEIEADAIVDPPAPRN